MSDRKMPSSKRGSEPNADLICGLLAQISASSHGGLVDSPQVQPREESDVMARVASAAKSRDESQSSTPQGSGPRTANDGQHTTVESGEASGARSSTAGGGAEGANGRRDDGKAATGANNRRRLISSSQLSIDTQEPDGVADVHYNNYNSSYNSNNRDPVGSSSNENVMSRRVERATRHNSLLPDDVLQWAEWTNVTERSVQSCVQHAICHMPYSTHPLHGEEMYSQRRLTARCDALSLSRPLTYPRFAQGAHDGCPAQGEGGGEGHGGGRAVDSDVCTSTSGIDPGHAPTLTHHALEILKAASILRASVPSRQRGFELCGSQNYLQHPYESFPSSFHCADETDVASSFPPKLPNSQTLNSSFTEASLAQSPQAYLLDAFQRDMTFEDLDEVR